MAYVAMTAAEEAENLRETLAVLNDTGEPNDDWKGKNWSHDDAEWLRRMVRALRGKGRIRLPDRERLEKFTKRIRVRTERDGSLSVIDYYDPDTAAMHFTRLIRNSRQALLRGPCLWLKCKKWYISKTNMKTDFCSRACAGNAMSARRNKRERDRKIEKARAALEKYEARSFFAGMDLDWKRYVSKVTGISKKFLTEAVRDGELLPPEVT